jgi:hypothetical protein
VEQQAEQEQADGERPKMPANDGWIPGVHRVILS